MSDFDNAVISGLKSTSASLTGLYEISVKLASRISAIEASLANPNAKIDSLETQLAEANAINKHRTANNKALALSASEAVTKLAEANAEIEHARENQIQILRHTESIEGERLKIEAELAEANAEIERRGSMMRVMYNNWPKDKATIRSWFDGSGKVKPLGGEV